MITNLEPWLIEEKKHEDYEKVLELYFNLMTFIKISDLYDDHYVTYIKEEYNDLIIKLYCVDSSHLLKEALLRGRSSIFFSATLTPLDYHMDLLGGDKEDYNIRLNSPFLGTTYAYYWQTIFPPGIKTGKDLPRCSQVY